MANDSIDLELADKLANDHWQYIEDTLRIHGVDPREIEVAKYHYMTAFIHGYKHAVEEHEEHGNRKTK